MRFSNYGVILVFKPYNSIFYKIVDTSLALVCEGEGLHDCRRSLPQEARSRQCVTFISLPNSLPGSINIAQHKAPLCFRKEGKERLSNAVFRKKTVYTHMRFVCRKLDVSRHLKKAGENLRADENLRDTTLTSNGFSSFTVLNAGVFLLQH